MLYIEVSAKTGSNIEECFTVAAKDIMNKIEQNLIDINDEV